jgi:hypothetical protein
MPLARSFAGHSGVMHQLTHVQAPNRSSGCVCVIYVSEILQSPLKRDGKFDNVEPSILRGCHFHLFNTEPFQKLNEVSFRFVIEGDLPSFVTPEPTKLIPVLPGSEFDGFG